MATTTRPSPVAAPADPVLAPLSVADAARLVRLAERAARSRGIPMTYDGQGALTTSSGMAAGLTNLARTVAGLPRQRWQDAVDAHFDQLGRTVPGPPRVPSDLGSSLYLRLLPAQCVPSEWADRMPQLVPGVLRVPATRADGRTQLYFDVEHLGMTTEEAQQVGLRNLRRLSDKVERYEVGGARLAILSGSPFSASRALVLDSVLRRSLRTDPTPHGVFAAFPCRDRLLLHVAESEESSATVLAAMIAATAHWFDCEPGPISPHVYHVDDGRWERIAHDCFATESF